MSRPVTWFVFDNFIAAEELAHRIGTFVNIIDDGGPSWVWGPLYVKPNTTDPTVFVVQDDRTLRLGSVITNPTKTWTTAATFQNNPWHYMIAQGEPLLTAEDLAHLQTIDFNEFVEYVIPEPVPEA